jgi:tol-pal system protein YbgF
MLFRTGFYMKRMGCVIFLFSFIFISGCLTVRQHQGQFQDQVSFILQEQKTQIETQQQIQNKLMELEKLLQEIDKKLSAAVIQKAESIPSHQAKISTLMESQSRNLSIPTGSQEAFQFLPLDKFVQDKKEISSKNKSVKQQLNHLEKDFQKTNNQAKIITEKTQKTWKIKPHMENIGQKNEKLKNIPPHDLYAQALEAFNKLEYPNALNLWSEMIDNFPEHTLVSNAFFWQGETHYQMQDFENAVVKYNKVIEQYAKSSKYPAALLKAGLSCFALNKNKEGELRLKELIEKFPDRAEAKRAGIFLQKR